MHVNSFSYDSPDFIFQALFFKMRQSSKTSPECGYWISLSIVRPTSKKLFTVYCAASVNLLNTHELDR